MNEGRRAGAYAVGINVPFEDPVMHNPAHRPHNPTTQPAARRLYVFPRDTEEEPAHSTALVPSLSCPARPSSSAHSAVAIRSDHASGA